MMAFRAQLSAAPLKQFDAFHGDVYNVDIPRSIERGPVEASMRGYDKSAAVAFRAQLSAAPLKLRSILPV